MIKRVVLLALLCHFVLAEKDSSDSSASNEILNATDSSKSLITENEIDQKIIGGLPGMFPFVPRLEAYFRKNRDICSGTVINNRIILTAASCVYKDGNRAIKVKTKVGRRHHTFSSTDILVHPGYNGFNRDNDLALLTLSHNNYMRDYGIPPSLPSPDILIEITPDTPALAVGWGKTSDMGKYSKEVRYATVNIIAPDECLNRIPSKLERSICTLNMGGRGICYGDVGGPLLVLNNGRYYIIGVASFMGSSRCEDTAPKGYTDISAYVEEWIRPFIIY